MDDEQKMTTPAEDESPVDTPVEETADTTADAGEATEADTTAEAGEATETDTTADAGEATETDTTAEAAEATEATETEETNESDEDDPLAGAFQYDTATPTPKKRRWPIVVLAVLLAVVFVGGLLWAFGVFKPKEPEETDVASLTAAQSANYTVTNGMFAFDMETMYKSFQSQYSYYLSSLGLDTTVSLKDQTAYNQSISWFDYFKNRTQDDVEWMLVMAEVARANGTELDATAAAQAESYVNSTDFSTYHNGVSAEDATAFLKLYYTALLQENAYYGSLHFTDEQLENYYAQNQKAMNVASYAYFAFSIGADGDFATADAAEATVARLAACKNEDEFRREVVSYLVSTGKYETEEAATAAYQASCRKSGVAYSDSDGISDWLFDSSTKVNDTKRLQNDTAVAVYMLTAAPARDTSKTVNVRHILLTESTYGSDEAAHAKAEEILAAWRSGEATADSFGALAAQYTEDSNGSSGGLYEGVTEGQMVTEFNDWCFDDARRVGDSDIVKTNYGYHVMYFAGTGEAWQTTAANALKEAAYQQQYAAYQQQYSVNFNEENINQNEL